MPGKKQAKPKAIEKQKGKQKKSGAGGKAKADNPAAFIAAARAAAFSDEAPERAFAHFQPLAAKVPAAGLAIFTGQPLLLRANVKTALEAVEPHLAAAVAKLRSPDLKEVLELPSLVMALEFAATRVPVAKLSAGEIDRMLNDGGPWRELMLTFLEVAAHPLIDLLPRERVTAVRTGSGKLDKAQDFVALAGLFAEFKGALAGKHPFPADKLELLATLGGALVLQVRPGKAITEAPKRTVEAILRDQLAALVADRYDDLQVLAAVALGKRRADALLPALRSAVAFGSGPGGEESPEAAAPTAPMGSAKPS